MSKSILKRKLPLTCARETDDYRKMKPTVPTRSFNVFLRFIVKERARIKYNNE